MNLTPKNDRNPSTLDHGQSRLKNLSDEELISSVHHVVRGEREK